MTTKGIGEHILKLRFAPQVAIFGRQQHRETASLATCYDRHFMDRVGVGEHTGNQSMAHFMVSSDSFFTLADDAALASRASHHAVDRLFQFTHANFAFIAPGSK